ncbi:MAG: hypothetical protein QM754_10255 [Tepidisphaeraceae bacterium]
MAHVLSAAAEFIEAVQAGAFDRAAAALPALPTSRDDALHQAVADLQSYQRNWAEAAEALAGLSGVEARHRATLYRNLAAIKTHRPFVYRQVLAEIEKPTARFRPHALAGGQMTVSIHTPDARLTVFSSDPAAQVAAAMQQLQPVIAAGGPLAFFSVADGHVLGAIAANPPKLFLDRQQPIYVVEPDLGLLVACLAIHDFTGPLGPIQQPRFNWYVGPKWLDAMRLDFLTDNGMLFPQTNIKQGVSSGAIEIGVTSLLGDIAELDKAADEEIAAYYGTMTDAKTASALSGEAGRAPRILLLTTRFSTVLQYSTRDAEAGLQRLGCETKVLIERAPHLGLTRLGMKRAVAEFKPDLVFQIDHNRCEHGDIFPPQLPFVNWIQDLLPHLMSKAVGAKLGRTDFVLTPSLQRWADDFDYPEHQCLEFRKLTRVPPRPMAQSSNSNRVVYVSNWSQQPQQLVDELLRGANETTRAVLLESANRMQAAYASGGALPSFGDVRRLLSGVMADQQVTADPAFVQQITTRLSDRLNNLLYRHQGLAWAAAACEKLGLSLEIYGNGWDKHPAFAKYARGNIEYGSPLEDLTRSAGINLILEPFMCMAHQRLLDALAAGGFCLVRDNPANHTCTQWIDLIDRSGQNVTTAAELREALNEAGRNEFDALVAYCRLLDGSTQPIDQVAVVRRLQQTGFFPTRGEVLPSIEAVTFQNAEAFELRLQRASQDPIFRTEVAGRQRRYVEDRYSYHGGMAKVLAFVAGRLAEPDLGQRKAA